MVNLFLIYISVKRKTDYCADLNFIHIINCFWNSGFISWFIINPILKGEHQLLSMSFWQRHIFHTYVDQFSLQWGHNERHVVSIVCSNVCSGARQRKRKRHWPFWWIYRWPVDFFHKVPVTRKCFHMVTSSCIRFISRLLVRGNEQSMIGEHLSHLTKVNICHLVLENNVAVNIYLPWTTVMSIHKLCVYNQTSYGSILRKQFHRTKYNCYQQPINMVHMNRKWQLYNNYIPT